MISPLIIFVRVRYVRTHSESDLAGKYVPAEDA